MNLSAELFFEFFEFFEEDVRVFVQVGTKRPEDALPLLFDSFILERERKREREREREREKYQNVILIVKLSILVKTD